MKYFLVFTLCIGFFSLGWETSTYTDKKIVQFFVKQATDIANQCHTTVNKWSI